MVVEYHDTCPACKKQMKEIDKGNGKNIFYYCENCKQKYRIDVIHPAQSIKCPCCKSVISISKDVLDELHSNTIFNFFIKKVRVKK